MTKRKVNSTYLCAIFGIYEPQSDDQNMNETRLSSLAKTELNKRKSAVMSYEITSTDLEVTYPHEIISIGDTVRVKHRDLTRHCM